MLLADLGATVVKVERPGSGDDTRAWGPPFDVDGQTTYFGSVNRNKLSVALDLTEEADLGVARALAAAADVLVENYRPGHLERFGLDYQSVRATNPTVVYCSINGFGSGEGAELPGYDLLVQATGGLMSITGTDEPTKTGVAVVDVLTGLHATVGILAALRQRERSGSGQQLEVTLLGSLLSGLVNQAAAYAAVGEVAGLLGNAHPSIAAYEVFATAGRPLVIAVGNDSQFLRLCQVLGAPELAEDQRYRTNPSRVKNRLELKADIEGKLAEHPAEAWYRLLTEAGVPAGPINDIAAAFELADQLGLNPIEEIHDPRRAHPTPTVANPVRFADAPVEYRLAPPRVGEDYEAVFALLSGRGNDLDC